MATPESSISPDYPSCEDCYAKSVGYLGEATDRSTDFLATFEAGRYSRVSCPVITEMALHNMMFENGLLTNNYPTHEDWMKEGDNLDKCLELRALVRALILSTIEKNERVNGELRIMLKKGGQNA